MSGSAWTGAAVAAVTAGYALFSRRLATTVVSAPMVFTGFGVAIGPIGLGLLDLEQDAGPVLTLVEVALTLVLLTDAMSVRRRDLRVGGFLPGRLLGIGLPLTIGAGWLLAWPLLPGLTVWELALVGTILAPTDAALGKTAVSNPRVPSLVRGGLNVESGLNDGMALPFFVLFLAALPGTTASEEGIAGVFWRALVLSTALGLAVGAGGGWLLRRSRDRGWVSGDWAQVFVLAVAAGSYTLAVVVGGSGFIAAWVAGFALGVSLRQGAAADAPPVDEDTAGLAERLAELLACLSFLVFGAVLLGPALEHLDWRIITYAVLSLTVVRMLPVALSLAGSRLRLPTVGYIGWFGPRGLASVVFGLLVVEEHLPGVPLLGRVIAVTVALSILLHGMSAVVLAERYGDWHEKAAARRPQLREGTPDGEDAGSSSAAR
ncbi:cation:proton antiporter [Streptomyces sp. NBC_01356]|uniref:cation:proton antiporter n=1 Tax=Streptomyces sp. NBC_01356 TaxID=2903836 RepID=UPI002E3719A7|nr:cation:proton antiporter [Streptomyces sp. NBC_01356]